MRKYFLMMIGNFENEDICKEMALTLTPIVDSPNLKFNVTSTCSIFHFASEVSQDEINEYIKVQLPQGISGFLLTECNDKMSVYFSEEIAEHLYDLENEGHGIEIRLTAEPETQNEDSKVDEKIGRAHV